MELTPDTELLFTRAIQGPPKQLLTIRNTLPETLAFKVKTTAPKQFVVRPNAGKLAAGESVEVTVLLQLRDGPIDTKRKDKFLVQAIKLPQSASSLEDDAFGSRVAELWAQAEQVKKQAGDQASDIVIEKKLRCTYNLEEPYGVVSDQSLPAPQVSTPQPSPVHHDPLKHRSSPSAPSDNRPASTYAAAEQHNETNASPEPMNNNPAATLQGPSSSNSMDKALRELKEAKDKITSLQSACDGYKAELERVNVIRQRRADATVPPTSTVTHSQSAKVKGAPPGVNTQIVAVLCFVFFLLGAWLF